ncbi:MAG: hypothetical protein V4574_12750 [Pseudomonadota bacterium]
MIDDRYRIEVEEQRAEEAPERDAWFGFAPPSGASKPPPPAARAGERNGG